MVEDSENKVHREALRLLGRRPYTASKLRRVLRRRHDAEPVERVLNALLDQGVLDDLAWARSHVAYHAGERGPRRLASDLRSAGISSGDIARALEGCGTDRETVTELLRRNLHRFRGLDPLVARRRATGFLARRGFEMDQVHQAVRALLSGDDDV